MSERLLVHGRDGQGTTVTAVLDVPVDAPAGILLSPAEIAALPTSGPAWAALLARANTLSADPSNVSVRGERGIDALAQALVGARLGDATRKQWVRNQIAVLIGATRDNNDVLATLRQLQTWVIAADLIGLSTLDPALDGQFRTWLDVERRHDYAGGGGGGSVIGTHEYKPNNFGTHAGSSRVAAALYLGDTADLAAAARTWQGWASGDPALIPAGYNWDPTTWHADPLRKAGINALGATRDGHRLDGIIPEDQRRCGSGSYSWPPCATNYIHGACDGMILSFWMLARRGFTPWAWGDQAALRQYQWKIEVGQPAYSGFRWQVPVINRVYMTAFGDADPAATSTNFGFAAWWTQPA